MSDDWLNDPERFVKPDPFVEGHRVIVDRDPGDENDARQRCFRCDGAITHDGRRCECTDAEEDSC